MTDTKLQYLIYSIVAVVAFVLGIVLMPVVTGDGISGTSLNKSIGSCNIPLIKLHGYVSSFTYASSGNSSDGSYPVADSEEITKKIRQADADSSSKAIVLEIDSNGGNVVAGEEIANELKRASKPTVAIIRGQGLSSAYWAASGAEVIFASANSEIGSIGVTGSYVDRSEYNRKEGYTYNSITTGAHKDATNENKALTSKERSEIQKEINSMMENFVQAIAINRHISLDSISHELRDARIFLGTEAIEEKLIDYIGDRVSVQEYLAKKLQLSEDDITYCE